MNEIINALIDIGSLRKVIDMHFTSLESIKNEKERINEELRIIKNQEEKIENQLKILLHYHHFVSNGGYDAVNLQPKEEK